MIIENSVLTPYELAITEKANKEAAFDNFRNIWFPSQLASINEQLEYASKIGNNFIILSVPKILNNYTFLQEEIEPMLIDLFNYVYNIEIKEETNTFVATISWDDNDTVRSITIEGNEVSFTLESNSEVVFCPEDTEKIVYEYIEDLITYDDNIWFDDSHPLTAIKPNALTKIEIYNTSSAAQAGGLTGAIGLVIQVPYVDPEGKFYELAFPNESQTLITFPQDLPDKLKSFWNEIITNHDGYFIINKKYLNDTDWQFTTKVYNQYEKQNFSPKPSTFPLVAPKDFVPQKDLEDVWKKGSVFTLQLKERDPSDINYGKETTLYIYNKNETSTN